MGTSTQASDARCVLSLDANDPDTEQRERSARRTQPDATVTGEDLKQKGNAAFQAADYVEAARLYSQALERLTDGTDHGTPLSREKLRIAIHANRAEARLRLAQESSSLELCRQAVEDCNAVLLLDPAHEKARLRKAKAFMGLLRAGGHSGVAEEDELRYELPTLVERYCRREDGKDWICGGKEFVLREVFSEVAGTRCLLPHVTLINDLLPGRYGPRGRGRKDSAAPEGEFCYGDAFLEGRGARAVGSGGGSAKGNAAALQVSGSGVKLQAPVGQAGNIRTPAAKACAQVLEEERGNFPLTTSKRLPRPDNLLVVLHGFGGCYKQFRSIPRDWRLPKTAYFFLNGPDRLDLDGLGMEDEEGDANLNDARSWFVYHDFENPRFRGPKGEEDWPWYPEFSQEAADNCAETVCNVLNHVVFDTLVRKCGWRLDEMFLIGHSQAGTLVLDFLTQRTRSLDLPSSSFAGPESGACGLAGAVAVGTNMLGARRKELLQQAENAKRKKLPDERSDGVDAGGSSLLDHTPLLMIHGEDDEVLAVREARETQAAIAAWHESYASRTYSASASAAATRTNTTSSGERCTAPRKSVLKVFPERGHEFVRGNHPAEMELFYTFLSDNFNGCGRKWQEKQTRRIANAEGWTQVA